MQVCAQQSSEVKLIWKILGLVNLIGLLTVGLLNMLMVILNLSEWHIMYNI